RETEGGYAWYFPKGEGRGNFGIMLSGEDGARVWQSLDSLKRRFYPDARIVSRVNGAVPLSLPVEHPSNGTVYLVGDAARLSNALSGGGIRNALLSGRMVGKHISSLWEGGKHRNPGVLEAFEAEWRDVFWSDLHRGVRMRERVFRGLRETHKLETLVRLASFIQRITPKTLMDAGMHMLLSRLSGSFL
ncbi:MAG: hypothetical protein J7L61_04830, partial [Thermoplasmata archaeon]|nr:hypothetical protein [Thermoplasmata archaeon]